MSLPLALVLSSGLWSLPDGPPERQAADDMPPPSMELLEFMALFETEDGEWMDPDDIPVPMGDQLRGSEPALPSTDSRAAPRDRLDLDGGNKDAGPGGQRHGV